MAEPAPALRLQGLVKRYGPASGPAAVDGVSLALPAGAVSVVMGLSGSGKSTLLRLINRLVEPSAGQVWCGDTEVTALAPEALRVFRQRHMAMVFQRHALLPHRSVLDNVAWPLRLAGQPLAQAHARARHWLARVGLAAQAGAWPAALSGGMQQRVGLARALAADAPLLLMDEAFSSLDPLHRREMQALLAGLQADLRKTVVFVTHDLDEAVRLADLLVILRDGRVLQQGPPAQVVLQPADDHVRRFVQALDRGRLLPCAALARPGPPGPGPVLAGGWALAEAARRLLAAGALQGNVQADDGRHLGTVDLAALLAQWGEPADAAVATG